MTYFDGSESQRKSFYISECVNPISARNSPIINVACLWKSGELNATITNTQRQGKSRFSKETVSQNDHRILSRRLAKNVNATEFQKNPNGQITGTRPIEEAEDTGARNKITLTFANKELNRNGDLN